MSKLISYDYLTVKDYDMAQCSVNNNSTYVYLKHQEEMYNVESWLSHHVVKLRQRFSLESYIFMNRLLSSTDITRDGQTFENKISKINSSIHVISIDSDIFFLHDEDKITTSRLKKQDVKIENHIIESIHGHDAFFIETKQISDIFIKILK